MNAKFFKQTITLFLLNKETEQLDRVVIKNVYFRHNQKNISIDIGNQRASSGTIIIPSAFAKIGNSLAILTYNQSQTQTLNFVLNTLLTDKIWDLKETSYVVEGEVEDLEYAELVEKYCVFRIVSVSDNRKGNLKHLKLEVSE